MATTNYQTIFGTTPISEPSTKGFDSGIQKSVNTEVDQGIGNLLVGVAQSAKQITDFGVEIGMQSAEADANDVLTQELQAMGPGGGEYLQQLKKKFGLAQGTSNETTRNLRLSKLRAELRAKHTGTKARVAIDRVYQQTIGITNPAGSIMDEANKTERAAMVARLAKHKEQLATAQSMGLTVYNNGKVDEAQTLFSLMSVQQTQGTYASAKSALKSGSGGVVGTKFRGKHLATFNIIRKNSIHETGLRIRSLLSAHKSADEIQKKVIAVELGNSIEGMRSRIEKQFTDETGKYLTESELAYITDEAMNIWRSLTRGTELQDSWIEGKLVEGVQLEALNKLVGHMTDGRMNSYPALRILNQFKGVSGSAALDHILGNLSNIEGDFKKAISSMDENETGKLTLAFKALTDPKVLRELSKTDKQLLGLPIKEITKTAKALVNKVEKEKGPDAASNICAGIMNTVNECMTSFDSTDNKAALMDVLGSENAISLIRRLSKDPNKQEVYRKSLYTLNYETSSVVPGLITDVVKEAQDHWGVKLKKGEIVWDEDEGLSISETARDRIANETGEDREDITMYEIDRAWDDDDNENPDKWLRRLGKFHEFVGPTIDGKKMGQNEWIREITLRMSNAAIQGTKYKRGWFGWGGFPRSKPKPKPKVDKTDKTGQRVVKAYP